MFGEYKWFYLIALFLDYVNKINFINIYLPLLFFYWLYSPCGPWPLFSFLIYSQSVGLVARPLPKHRTAQTQNKHIYIPNIHALSGIRIHDHRVRASEEGSSCVRPLAYRDRHLPLSYFLMPRLFNFKESRSLTTCLINQRNLKELCSKKIDTALISVPQVYNTYFLWLFFRIVRKVA
jgi:hypothetical protein